MQSSVHHIPRWPNIVNQVFFVVLKFQHAGLSAIVSLFCCTTLKALPWLLRLDRCLCTMSSLNTALMNHTAALNVFPLSETNLSGIPLLAANRLRHLRNVSGDKSQCQGVLLERCSKWKGLSTLCWMQSGQMNGCRADLQSPHLWMYAVVPPSLWLLVKVGVVEHDMQLLLSWHKTQQLIMDLTKLRPIMIQNLALTSLRVSLAPLWLTRLCTSRTIIAANGWSGGSNTGCFVLYGRSAFASLPPQRHKPLLSTKRSSCLCQVLKHFSWVSCACAWVTHNLSESASSSVVSTTEQVNAEEPDLNLFTALRTYAALSVDVTWWSPQ